MIMEINDKDIPSIPQEPQEQKMSSENSGVPEKNKQFPQEVNMENNHINEQVESSNKLYEDEMDLNDKEFYDDMREAEAYKKEIAELEVKRFLDPNKHEDQKVFVDWFNETKSARTPALEIGRDAQILMSNMIKNNSRQGDEVVHIAEFTNGKVGYQKEMPHLERLLNFATAEGFLQTSYEMLRDETKAYERDQNKNYRSLEADKDIRAMLEDKDRIQLYCEGIDNEYAARQRLAREPFEPAHTIINIPDPEQRDIEFALAWNEIPKEYRILKDDYLQKVEFMPPMKVDEVGNVHIYVEPDKLNSNFATSNRWEGKINAAQKNGMAEIIMSKQLAAEMIKTSMYEAYLSDKNVDMPSVSAIPKQYADGMKKAFPNMSDSEASKEYKKSFSTVQKSLHESFNFGQAQTKNFGVER